MLVWPHQMYLTGVANDLINTPACDCRASDAGMASSDVSDRHHSRCHTHGGIWLVQHLEHVDSSHLLHGAQECYGKDASANACTLSMSRTANVHISNSYKSAICSYCMCMHFELGLISYELGFISYGITVI